MNVRFIDTSVMLNLLEVPNMCGDAEKVKMEWKRNLEANDVLIMPSATIIETGNHIAHISNGNKRRDMSIVYAYERYIEETPGVGTIMIWSTDTHLQGYRKENVSMSRRRRK